MLNYILVFGVNMILFHVNYARRAAIQQERQLAEAEVAAQQAQLAALRYQLNPHFLFNALNSISALIVTRRNEDAEQMTKKLSSFLRASLNADPSELIPLDEELALTEEYLDIESVRFGDRLGIACRLQRRGLPCARAELPGPAARRECGEAWRRPLARAGRDRHHEADKAGRCASRSPMPRPARRTRSSGRAGVGLDNVRHRLEAVFGARASLTAGETDGRFVATIRWSWKTRRIWTTFPPIAR